MPNKTNSQIEHRAFVIDELRVQDDDGKIVIAGHAAVFNKLSDDLGGFREIIAPGAFKDSLKNADVRALFNHDPNIVLGRNKAGTLAVAEDKKGLAIEINPPDTQASRDLVVSMERGDVTEMSFGFRTIEDKWETKDGEDVRTLLKVDLFDVSPATFAAYPQTDVGVAKRSLDNWRAEQEAREDPPPEPEPETDDAGDDGNDDGDDVGDGEDGGDGPRNLDIMRARTQHADLA